ncbi:MAG TPA: type II secretion system F family protein [Hyphomicrobiaceae bacterium]|nr:type II secretion system F family protein [Hyphomicrobiaceae bacterium]
MLDGQNLQLILGVVIALSVGGIIYVLAYPYLSGEVQTDKRIQGVTEAKSRRSQRKGSQADIASTKRKQVADTLKELEERQKAKDKISMKLRLQRAGLDATPSMFWIASAICGAVCGAGAFFAFPSMPPYVAGAAAFVGALGLPRWILMQMTKWRQAKFLNEFANAIDIIVRGVKSGLPLNECLGIISRESPSPIKEEFQEIVEQQRVGVPLVDCFDRMMQRIPLAEVKFFAIVLGIQAQAGGNLSEALGNLSGVLRDRKKMQGKVKALSAEAKASAMVLGALPFIVMTMVYVTTPDYIALLFTKKMGQFLLVAAAVWMSAGIFIMRKMINFKF